MAKKATTVEALLAGLPEDRRKALKAVRAVILENLSSGYEEGIQYGMIGYYVPHSVFPPGYHCDPKQPLPFAGLASQKNHMAIYLMCVYGDPKLDAWFQKAWKATGKKLDMGKSCVRFKKLEDVPLKVLGQVIKKVPVEKYIKSYEATLAGMASRRPAKRKTSKTATKKTAGAKSSSAKTATKGKKKSTGRTKKK